MDDDGGPFRYVVTVIGALAFVFVAVSVGLLFDPASELTAPLVLAVPVAVGAVYYWYFRR